MGSWIQTSHIVLFVVNGPIKEEIEKQSGQYLGFICDESLTCRGLNLNPGHFRGSAILLLFHVENHICLSRGVHVAGATWRITMRIVAGVEDLMQRTGDGQAHVGYSVVRRSGGRVTLCAVCTVHEETSSAGFLIDPQNQGRQVFRFGH
jgi:hypothetical protein